MDERWWTWHWDQLQVVGVNVPCVDLTRWRRGSLLTVYRFRYANETQWWFYGPFNLAIGFGHPRR